MHQKFLFLLFIASLNAEAVTPNELLINYTAEAGRPSNVARGEAFFKASHGQEWQCISCHGKSPVTEGRHASTNKAIEPLAPSANTKRFTDNSKVEKWFRRNCKDVLARECTSAEKADVLAWLISLR
jgi:hypothetical protein